MRRDCCVRQEGERDPNTFNERWKLGDDDGIHPEDINIIGLLHVSRGTWMPILQLSGHIIPRWDYFEDGLLKAEAEAETQEGGEDPTREGHDNDDPMAQKRKDEKKEKDVAAADICGSPNEK